MKMKWGLLVIPVALAACTQAPPVTFPAYSDVSPFANRNALTVLRGTVQDVPRDELGRPESVMIQTADGVRQVHLPGSLQSSVGTALATGDKVEAVAAPVATAGGAGGASGTPEYRLVSLRDGKGRMFAQFDPSHDRYVHVEGTIRRLLTDEVDQGADAAGAGAASRPAQVITGVQLNTGDIVRLTPTQAKQHEVAVGAEFSADGPAVPAPSGGLFVLAQDVNGVTMRVYLPPTGWGVKIVGDEDNGDNGSVDMGGDYVGGE